MKKHAREDFTVPALVGAYAVGGLLIGRALRSSSSPLKFEQLLLVGGTSAVAAYVAPMVTHRVVSKWSPSTPIVNAAISSGLAWAAFRAESFDADSAAMFVPVQMASSLLAEYVAHQMKKKSPESN